MKTYETETETMIKTRLEQAIESSQAEDRIVTVVCDDPEMAEYLLSDILPNESEVDSRLLEDGSIDIWGWTDETPDNEQDWRLTLRKYAH